MPANTTAVPGSLLLIAQPEYLEFTSSQELLPIIYESVEGDWSAIVQANPPQGFVSTPGALSTSVSDSRLQALQFTITDVGSKWTSTSITHHLKHNGRDITISSSTGMVNKQKRGPAGNLVSNGEGDLAAELNFIPTEFALSQNYPDPFNPSTQIQFDLPERSNVKIVIYDILGREVMTLVNGELEAGRYREVWEGRDHFGRTLSSGVYLYRMTASSLTGNKYLASLRKMLLLR